jgi:HKD family nuclease
MHKQIFIVQDSSSGMPSQIFRTITGLARAEAFQSLRIAVAYASLKGCRDLVEGLKDGMRDWVGVTKEWLISIDFGRTEPEALDFLRKIPNSAVRVPDGVYLLSRSLIPESCFHSKTFIFEVDHNNLNDPFAVFTGSANLTRSGLFTGTEHGVALLWIPPLSQLERKYLRMVKESLFWWDKVWNKSDKVSDEFIEKYKKIRPRHIKEDDAETVKVFTSSGDLVVKPLQGLTWSHLRCFWIQTYKLYENRGMGKPGNQLDCSKGTRVYFGFSPEKVNPNTKLGYIFLQYMDMPPVRRAVWFGHNYMDKVHLPIPGENGPASYDNSYVLFERMDRKRFRITLASQNEVKIWKKKSKDQGMFYTMSGGRKCGFYS